MENNNTAGTCAPSPFNPLTVEQIIQFYDLQAHPEGGYFKETYRSLDVIGQTALPSRFSGPRSFSTAIYYLLPSGQKSHLHRIASDETWHFYLGGPLMLIEISPDGRVSKTILGQDIRLGQKLQHTVAAGNWFGAYPEQEYSFVGCTVAPGFDFADFEMGERTDLISRYPSAKNEINRLTTLKK